MPRSFRSKLNSLRVTIPAVLVAAIASTHVYVVSLSFGVDLAVLSGAVNVFVTGWFVHATRRESAEDTVNAMEPPEDESLDSIGNHGYAVPTGLDELDLVEKVETVNKKPIDKTVKEY